MFCQWTAPVIRHGVEVGTCRRCGYCGLTFRRRVCPASN
jgi:hypothetical protein